MENRSYDNGDDIVNLLQTPRVSAFSLYVTLLHEEVTIIYRYFVSKYMTYGGLTG